MFSKLSAVVDGYSWPSLRICALKVETLVIELQMEDGDIPMGFWEDVGPTIEVGILFMEW